MTDICREKGCNRFGERKNGMRRKKKEFMMKLTALFLCLAIAGGTAPCAVSAQEGYVQKTEENIEWHIETGEQAQMPQDESPFVQVEEYMQICLPGENVLQSASRESCDERISVTINYQVDESEKNISEPAVEKNVYVDEFVEIYPPQSMTRTSYESRTHVRDIDFVVNGITYATLTMTYEVWYYTDGKVHLYSRYARLYKQPEASESFFTYGRIVNTDGTVSYTSGDQVTFKYKNLINDVKGVEFSVTGDDIYWGYVSI